jgi:hypothetical protein
MTSIIIAGIVGFVLGAAVVLARYVQRSELAWQSDPWTTPPNGEVRAFVEAVNEHMAAWRSHGWQRRSTNIQNVGQALEILESYSRRRAVWTVKDGMATLQDGTQIPLYAIVPALQRTLKGTPQVQLLKASLRDLAQVTA